MNPDHFRYCCFDKQIRNQALKAGAIDILSKPFSDERLASCLVSALNTSGSAASDYVRFWH